MAHFEDEEDTTSVCKPLPETKYQEGKHLESRIGSTLSLSALKVEEPPMVANFDPSRSVRLERIVSKQKSPYAQMWHYELYAVTARR